MRWPVDNPNFGGPNSDFGMRLHPTLGYERMHYGQDFQNNTGSPLYAVDNGVVSSSVSLAQNPGGGNYIAIRLGNGAYARYFHMQSQSPLRAGDRVKIGDVVGRLGNTGSWTTGPHLHFEIIDAAGNYTDPRKYIQARLGDTSMSNPTNPSPEDESIMTPAQEAKLDRAIALAESLTTEVGKVKVAVGGMAPLTGNIERVVNAIHGRVVGDESDLAKVKVAVGNTYNEVHEIRGNFPA